MKKFKFRLQRVLDFRKLVCDEKKRELLARNHELAQAEEQLRSLEQAEQGNLIVQGQVVDVSQILLNGLFGSRLKDQIVAQRLAIISAQDRAEQARLAYIEAAKDEKALITLKQKKFEEYKHYIELEEGKALDEFSISRGNTFVNKDADATL